MNSINLIEYLWETKVYNIEDMLKLVDNKIINKEQFFEITRKKYAGANSKISKSKSKDL